MHLVQVDYQSVKVVKWHLYRVEGRGYYGITLLFQAEFRENICTANGDILQRSQPFAVLHQVFLHYKTGVIVWVFSISVVPLVNAVEDRQRWLTYVKSI